MTSSRDGNLFEVVSGFCASSILVPSIATFTELQYNNPKNRIVHVPADSRPYLGRGVSRRRFHLPLLTKISFKFSFVPQAIKALHQLK